MISRQAAEAAVKAEREKKRKPVEEAPAPPVQAQAATGSRPKQSKPAEAKAEAPTAQIAEAKPAGGTLHKPASKPGTTSRQEGAEESWPKDTGWRDEAAKRRTIKTRGDEGGAGGWHARKDRHARSRTTKRCTAPSMPSLCRPSRSCMRY